MSVLDNINPSSQPASDYNFQDGDLDFINELEQPKQPMDINERPDFEPQQQQPDDLFVEDDGQHDELIAAAVEETATLVTDTIDSGAAFGLSLISKNPIESHRATADQKSRMRKIIYVYCEKTGGYIPLWLQLVILIIGIYGTQIPAAIDARKMNMLQEKVKEQEAKIKAYELEKQSQQLADQLLQQKQQDNA
jgi:hypothetical protein